MLRKPLRSRSGRLRSDGDSVNRGSRAILRVASRSRTRTITAPLATPEDDCNRTFEFGMQIGRRLSRSIGRFERRHSLGREKPRPQTPIAKEHHSAVEFTDIEPSREI
ncbi:unnamed protein product [Cylicocyclus nassatus]|uniref:Uncharacterized protein n=1 Tax=Cylicocyclus nassatus TaxID=53992 RepID=A0AA36HDW4_CYLNA|nr:unnamed protein product [Cylicocyclus nassatus]